MEHLIIKYLTNSISEEEQLSLKVWLKSKKNQEVFKSIVKTNQKIDAVYKRNDIDLVSAHNNIQNVLSGSRIIPLKTFKSIFRYAAVILMAFGLFFGFHSILNVDTVAPKKMISIQLDDGTSYEIKKNSALELKDNQGRIIAYVKNDTLLYLKNSIPRKSNYHTLNVPNGELFNVILDDGTIVTINSGSSLKYFNTSSNLDTTRNIYLSGEAYFNVAKNEKQPFIVHTKDLDIRVLGTKFNVSSYQNDDNSSVLLEEGSVSVNKVLVGHEPKKIIIIKPNQQLVFTKEKQSIQKVSIDKHIAWKKRQLFFKNDRFEDILKEMERYYDITIKINSSSLKKRRYTGTFTTETIDEALEVFKELSHFNYNISNNSIIITKSSD